MISYSVDNRQIFCYRSRAAVPREREASQGGGQIVPYVDFSESQ
jgi:hypothetical protein